MEINFGQRITNVGVQFNSTGNYLYGDRYFYIHGAKWNGFAEFPNGARKISLKNSYMLNSEVIIPNNTADASEFLENCYAFNQPIDFPDTITNVSRSFYNCSALNKPIHLSNSVTNCKEMFCNCQLFNQDIDIPNSVTNCEAMFCNCISFNKNVNIPDVESIYKMFYDCTSYNSSVSFPENIVNMSESFHNCWAFNYQVNIFEKVTDISKAFSNCYNLEHASIMSSNIENAYMAFYDCQNLKNVGIFSFDKIVNGSGMFFNCQNLVLVNDLSTFNVINLTNLIDGSRMFEGLNLNTFYGSNNWSNWNTDPGKLYIEFGNNLKNMYSMFKNVDYQDPPGTGDMSYITIGNFLQNESVNFKAVKNFVNAFRRNDSPLKYVPFGRNANIYIGFQTEQEVIDKWNETHDNDYTLYNYEINCCNMFYGFTFLRNANICLSPFITNCYGMFYNAAYLQPYGTITIPERCTNASRMFQKATGGFGVIIDNNCRVNDCSYMFANSGVNDSSITWQDPYNVSCVFELKNARNTAYMFQNCRRLNAKINFGTRLENSAWMFENCFSLNQNINLLQIHIMGDCTDMFYGCNKLRTVAVNLYSFWAEDIYGQRNDGLDMRDIFGGLWLNNGGLTNIALGDLSATTRGALNGCIPFRSSVGLNIHTTDEVVNLLTDPQPSYSNNYLNVYRVDGVVTTIKSFTGSNPWYNEQYNLYIYNDFNTFLEENFD